MLKKNFNLMIGDITDTSYMEDRWKVRIITHIDLVEKYGDEERSWDDAMTRVSWEVYDKDAWWKHVRKNVKNYNKSTSPYAFTGECSYQSIKSYISKNNMFLR